MKPFVIMLISIIFLLSTLSSFAENMKTFKEQDFVGKFILTDPACSYEKYHGEIILSADGKGKSKEYVDNKLFEPPYQDLLDKDGYLPLRWSFDEKRGKLIVDWTMNGEYSRLAYFNSMVRGDVNTFTLNGLDWDDSVCELIFTRVEGEVPKAVLKAENFVGLYELKNPDEAAYYCEVLILNDGTGKAREYRDNKPVKPEHPETLDKYGYLPVKWSFDEKTMEFIFDWTCGGKYQGLSCFKGKVMDFNGFTLDGTWTSGYKGQLNFLRTE